MKRKSVYILNNLNEEHLGGGGTRLVFSPQRGEEAIVHERIASVTSAGEGEIAAKQLGSGATHVALCDNIRSYFIHWCEVLAAKSLEVDKSVSRWDDKSETVVGRICQSDNKIKTLYNTS